MDGIIPDSIDTRNIPLDLIDASPTNPRKTIDEAKLAELGASMASPVGQIHPILVRPAGERFEIVAGERRWRAAGIAGLATIRAEVRDIPDDVVREMQLVENAGREDVHPLEEAIALDGLVQCGRTPEYLADRLGRPVRWVQRRIALLGLVDEARAWLQSGRLPITHAQQLAALAPSTQQRVLARYHHDRPIPSAREFARDIGYESHAVAAAPFDTEDKTLPGRGPCAKCFHRSDAQADLFSGASSDALCLDAACWNTKADATWLRVERDASKRKLTVIADPSEVFQYGDNLAWNSPYATTPPTEDAKPVAVAKAPSGRAIELYAKPSQAAKGTAERVIERSQEDEVDEDDESEEERNERVQIDTERTARKAAAEAGHRARAEKLLAIAGTKSGALLLLRAGLIGYLEGFHSPVLRPLLSLLGAAPATLELTDETLVDAIDESDVLRVVAAVLGDAQAEAAESMRADGEELSELNEQLLALVKGEAPAVAPDALIELVGPPGWVPESDVEVFDPTAACFWTPVDPDARESVALRTVLRTVLPESLATKLLEQLAEIAVPVERRAPTGPSHVVRVGDVVRLFAERGEGEDAGVVGFVRDDGPSGAVLLVGGERQVAWGDTVEDKHGRLVFRPEVRGRVVDQEPDGYWTVGEVIAAAPAKRSKKNASSRLASAPTEAEEAGTESATTELRVKRGDWLQHRSGLRDTAKAPLHKQWEPDGDDRVARVERGAAVVAQVLDYCREHKVPLRLNGAELLAPEAPAKAPKASKSSKGATAPKPPATTPDEASAPEDDSRFDPLRGTVLVFRDDDYWGRNGKKGVGSDRSLSASQGGIGSTCGGDLRPFTIVGPVRPGDARIEAAMAAATKAGVSFLALYDVDTSEARTLAEKPDAAWTVAKPAKTSNKPAAPTAPAPRVERVADDVLAVLSTMEVDGTLAKITEGTLDRKLYERTNKVLEALGGTWSKKLKGHVFAEDPRDALDGVILTGEVAHARDVLGFFPTPMELVRELLSLAGGADEGVTLLEPSAGEGAIVGAAITRGYTVTAVEIDPKRHRTIGGRYSDLLAANVCADLLRWDTDERFDRVVMNPPFARGQDVEHVTYAFRLLKPGGRLVAVMSAGVAFREDRKTVAFRELVREAGGTITENPEGSFKSSGTAVRTVTVVMDRKAVA